jgi:glycosyltransferase involved in cell wall biosynthesis
MLPRHREVTDEAAQAHGAPRVSIIMPFLNLAHFIEESIDSVLTQTYPHWELLLVDDGSTDGSTEIARRYAERHPDRIRYFEHDGHVNRGASASRNLGIRHARGEYIALLDADDVWVPEKLEQQVPMLDAHPSVGSLYGNTLFWYSWDRDELGEHQDFIPPLGLKPRAAYAPPDLLVACLRGGAAVPCTCSILMRRSIVEEVGGFEEGFRRVFTDQAFYTKLFLAAPVYITDHCWDKYRQHQDSSCSIVERAGQLEARGLAYLKWVEEFLTTRGDTQGPVWDALQDAFWSHRHPRLHRLRRTIRRSKRAMTAALKATIERVLSPPQYHRLRAWTHTSYPKVGLVRFGSLRRLAPISDHFGYDRGQPVDRYYIENFLDKHRIDIQGRVLEIGDAAYTRQFGGDRVQQSDVLHIDASNPNATIVADLASADHIPSDSFDCIICAQTLHLIYDASAAVQTLHRILKPGGILLLTAPGISQIDRGEWGSTWHWSFTTASLERMMGEAFPAKSFRVEAHGNVLAASAFLYGLAAHELRQKELDHFDPCYQVVITVRAVKPGGTA